jgi:hypothetical protein
MDAYFNSAKASERKTTDEVIKAQEILDNEFHAVGAEVGWFYPEADFAGEVAATGRRLAERGRNSGLSILSSFDHPRTLPCTCLASQEWSS